MGKHKGFTLIEIVLFLGVTAAMFIGITVGMQTSIARQRYDDAVQNFLEFMRSIYSQVSNPQSAGKGNSLDNAIYGKLVVFGEDYDLNGSRITDGLRPIFTYDVVGKAVGSQDVGSGTVSNLLANLGANPFIITRNGSGQITDARLAAPEKYEMRWQTEVLNTSGGLFTGSILVVRHPRSGTIHTLVLHNNEVIQVNEQINNINLNIFNGVPDLLSKHLDGSRNNSQFELKEIDFCVNSGATVLPKQDIRLIANARNASGVEKVEADTPLGSEGNRCP